MNSCPQNKIFSACSTFVHVQGSGRAIGTGGVVDGELEGFRDLKELPVLNGSEKEGSDEVEG